MRILPPICTKITMMHDGWVVGSAAIEDINEPKDIDIIVSFEHWKHVACLIPITAIPNSFGGWKFRDGEISVDVWPGDLAWLLTQSMCIAIWNPKSGFRYRRLK